MTAVDIHDNPPHLPQSPLLSAGTLASIGNRESPVAEVHCRLQSRLTSVSMYASRHGRDVFRVGGSFQVVW